MSEKETSCKWKNDHIQNLNELGIFLAQIFWVSLHCLSTRVIEYSTFMQPKKHPFINPHSGAFASYIDIDPLYLSRKSVDGFDRTRPDQMLRYTPITISQEELIYHKNINYEEHGLRYPRYIEEMFHNEAYNQTFSGSPVASFTLKFVEDPNSRVKVFIGITMYQEPCAGLNDIRKVVRSSTQDKSENFEEQASRSGGVPGTMVGILDNIAHWVKTSEYEWDEI